MRFHMVVCARVISEPEELQPSARRGRSRTGLVAWIPNHVVSDEPVPDEQYEQRTDSRANEAGTLVDPVPADGLADESGEERAGDPQEGRQDEPRGVVLPW